MANDKKAEPNHDNAKLALAVKLVIEIYTRKHLFNHSIFYSYQVILVDDIGRYLFPYDLPEYCVSARLCNLRFRYFISHVGAG